MPAVLSGRTRKILSRISHLKGALSAVARETVVLLLFSRRLMNHLERGMYKATGSPFRRNDTWCRLQGQVMVRIEGRIARTNNNFPMARPAEVLNEKRDKKQCAAQSAVSAWSNRFLRAAMKHRLSSLVPRINVL